MIYSSMYKIRNILRINAIEILTNNSLQEGPKVYYVISKFSWFATSA